MVIEGEIGEENSGGTGEKYMSCEVCLPERNATLKYKDTSETTDIEAGEMINASIGLPQRNLIGVDMRKNMVPKCSMMIFNPRSPKL